MEEENKEEKNEKKRLWQDRKREVDTGGERGGLRPRGRMKIKR